MEGKGKNGRMHHSHRTVDYDKLKMHTVNPRVKPQKLKQRVIANKQ